MKHICTFLAHGVQFSQQSMSRSSKATEIKQANNLRGKKTDLSWEFRDGHID